MHTLKLTSPPMFGLAVKRFQQFGEAIIEADFLRNDGYFGKKTKALARSVQEKLRLDIDGIVGPKTWSAIFEYLDRGPTGEKEYFIDGVKVIDGRDVWVPVKKWTQHKNRTYERTKGRYHLNGVMLHQTGCKMPEKPSVWNKINAHCGITHKGVVILMFPFPYMIWHGHTPSKNTVGVEIAGLFVGLKDKINTHWPPDATPDELSLKQVKAANVLFKILDEEFRKNGGRIEYIHAHRQSSKMRMSDPGQEVWEQIALPWLKQLRASDGGPEYSSGSGFPIPKEWNPEYKHKFWDINR